MMYINFNLIPKNINYVEIVILIHISTYITLINNATMVNTNLLYLLFINEVYNNDCNQIS